MDGTRLSSDREFHGVDDYRGGVNCAREASGDDGAYPESINDLLCGRVFDTSEELYDTVVELAKERGFGIASKGWKKQKTTGIPIKQVLECNRGKSRKTEEKDRKRKRSSFRIDCPWRAYIRLYAGHNKWELMITEDHHNHEADAGRARQAPPTSHKKHGSSALNPPELGTAVPGISRRSGVSATREDDNNGKIETRGSVGGEADAAANRQANGGMVNVSRDSEGNFVSFGFKRARIETQQFSILDETWSEHSWVDDELVFFFKIYLEEQLTAARVPWKVQIHDSVAWKPAIGDDDDFEKAKASFPSVTEYDHVVCPTNFWNHWVLVIFSNMKTACNGGRGSISVLDPKYDDPKYEKFQEMLCRRASVVVYERGLGKLETSNVDFYRAGNVLPRQPRDNNDDCGLYIMVYLERFLREPDDFLGSLAESRPRLTPSFEGRELRRRLRKLLLAFERNGLCDGCLVDDSGSPVFNGDLSKVFRWTDGWVSQ